MSFDDFLNNFDSFKAKLKKLPEYLKEETSLNSILQKNRFRIVFVGGVGVGKSSLLERLTGVKLPKGNNCCTRRPVIISSPDEVTFDAAAVGIISKEPIIVNNKKSTTNTNKNVHFEFIDLPGLTSMSRPDQPGTYPQFTRELLDIYTPTADIIILCVPVDADLVNSDALKYVKSLEIDDRVICVLSKIDLLEQREGEGLFDTQLEITKTFSGVVEVRNAPLLEMSDPIRSTNQKEEEFFASKTNGNFGIKSVKSEIIKVAQSIFDRMKREILVRLWKEKVGLERRLVHLKDPNFSLKLLSDYIDHATSIRTSLTSDYEGCARIGYVFWKSLPEALESIDPLNGIDREHLAILMKNAQGLKAGVQFESAFKQLLKTQLRASETVIWDCLNMILKEFREFLLVPIEEKDHEEEEFYDVKSVSDSDLEDELGFNDIQSFSSIKGQLSMLPDLPEFINKTVLGVLAESYEKTRRYLEEYCAMQKETIFCSESGYFEAFKQYEKERDSSEDAYITPKLTTNRNTALHSSSDDLPLKRIQSESLEAIPAKSTEESSFLKEFLALLFPTISDVKRVEYRPRKRLTRKITVDSRQVPISPTEKRDEDLLLILLEIYLKSYHRQLSDFLPKCINYHLIGGTLRGFPAVLYQTWRGRSEGEQEEMKKIERVIRLIEEINSI